MAVHISRWSRAYVQCQDCELLHPESTRQRVRSHVAKTGHRARVVTEAITEYRPEESQ